MEPLFRLALQRPAIAQDPTTPSITVAQDTPFQKALADAAKTPDPRPALLNAARGYIASTSFLGSPDANPLAAKLKTFEAALDKLESNSTVTHADVAKAVSDAFGTSPQAFVQSSAYKVPLGELRDSLLAIKQVQEEHGRPIEGLANQLRDLELIAKVAADSNFPKSSAELRRFRKRSFVLPPVANLKSIISSAHADDLRRKAMAEAQAARRKQAETLFNTYLSLTAAVGELTNLSGDHFVATAQELQAGYIPSADFTPSSVLSRQSSFVQKLSDLNLKQIQLALDRGPVSDPIKIQDGAGASSASVLAGEVLTNGIRLLDGSPSFHPIHFGESGFLANEGALAALTEGTRSVLSQRSIVLTARPLDRIVESLQTELVAATKGLEAFYGQAYERSFKRVGDALVTITTPVPSVWTNVSVGSPLPIPLPPAAVEQVPHTRGNVAPAGIADLIIVKQQLTGYEAADVAHIENVLKGERKQNEHIRRTETQQLTFTETEVTTTEERELQTTDRFEMSRETDNTIKEDASLKAGVTISGKYGPTVDFSASAEGSTSRSKEEATKSAASFSQEVTQRSASKITKRVLERTSFQVTNAVTERNTHDLDNTGGSGHISGVYQWVNKVYQAQMYNYGLRTMFDFMVPEPAAYLMEAMKNANASAVELQKPPDFTLRPNEITEQNFGFWVRSYNATDVVPPPEIYKTKSLDFKAGGGDDSTNYNHSAQITIDEGYRAIQGTVSAVWNIWEANYSIDLALGQNVHRISGDKGWIWATPLSDERDTIPFALDTFRVSQVAVAVEVKCQRTDRALDAWRFDTHAKLTSAYKARLSEYEEKLAALKAEAGIPIRGKNPAINLQLMQDELKKHCTSILTDQHFDLFNSIEPSAGDGLPEINIDEAGAEGSYVRFFEQAFEWEEMTWITYPYFWGRKEKWGERLAFEDDDPLFNQFLKAGFCRVSVPARLGFEGAIDHFMTYGELWNGGPLPSISSPLYLPIADEIAERLDHPGDEVPQGDPWLVRIPTTLIHLRADDKLPQWVQGPDGEWTEA